MKKPRNKKLTIEILLAIILIAGLISLYIDKGFHHVDPASERRNANKELQAGQIINGLESYAKSFIMALDAGVRWDIADIFINRVGSQEKQGQLKEALNNCATAVRILHGYDDEGALSYHCTVIQDTINRQLAPTPSP